MGRLGHTLKNFITFQTNYPERFSILIFEKKGLGLASLSHFVHDFSRKIFLMLYFINELTILTWKNLCLTEFSTKLSLKYKVGCF